MSAQTCGEPMVNGGNAHQHRCQVQVGNHAVDDEENADIHVCQCMYMWVVT